MARTRSTIPSTPRTAATSSTDGTIISKHRWEATSASAPSLTNPCPKAESRNRVKLWLWIGAVHFIPVPAVVPENRRGVCGLFQQKSSGILHIVESKQDLLAVNRQYWTVGHYDLLAYPPREHSVTGYSTFRAKSFRG